ncbi:hybrid sensor histidine kinase/response regulator [Massilia sp. CFBP9026]|uniref:hybrid sensor histidine kinase/response regulator n=1 Tax=Massilia sp. CFBP9026 TaxID=3096536 RepID=UPI002A6A8564|nr:PAS domain-containing protein [Massilia sp. CFBP9026]MDY0963254.1 PAS domain-containing protein [Massilia sp. CFBP9026]
MQENRATTTQQDTITLGWTLFEAIPDCVKLLGMDGLVLAINRNGLLSMEIDDIETVRGKPWTAYWPQPSHAVVDAALDAARAGGTGHFSAACATVKGRPKWWDVMVTRTAASDGQETRLLVISRDITEQVRLDAERKEAERALHASRERFEKIVSQAATGVVQMDTAGRIVLANQKYCAMVGRSEAELLGLSVAEVTAPQSRAQTHDALERLKAGAAGVALDKYYLHRDGSLVSATSSVNALRGPDGEFEGLVAIVLDTTESKQVQERLRASEERYRTLFESVDQGFCIFEMIFDDAGKAVDYRFLEMNPMFERHTGLVDAIGRTAREMLPALDDFWFETYGRVALTGIPARFENEAPAMGRWFDVYANRIGGPDSRKVALLFSEITARKRSEEELRRLADDLAEADRRKTEFLATLAHELRNPLAPIRNGLSVMRLGGDNPAAVGKVREMMERQVGHMVHLIDDLLDVARISGGKLELKRQRADLRAILASAVETSLPLIEAGQHALEVDVPDLPLLVDADATRIAQVVANLLNNAAKYTPARGRIRLSVRREGVDAVIAVSDTGVGIAGDALAGVFDMFSQIGRTVDRSQGGLGIGLSLVRRLVEMHGGSVVAESGGANAGSVFTVRLPLAEVTDGRAAHPQGEGAPARDGGAGLKVLVVDDNVDAALTLSMILEASGYVTRVAHDGHAALEAAREFRPRIAFLDIGMPGMSGYDTARAMRAMEELDGIVLVALTGWGAESDRQRSSEAGFDHHLTKPVQLEVVEELLGQM